MNKSCERCGLPFTLTADPGCPQVWVEKLASQVHFCQRCADYGWTRCQLHDQIIKSGIRLRVTREKTNQTERDKQTITDNIDIMNRLCRSFAQKACEFYRVRFLWDETLMDTLVQYPQKIETALNMYESGIRNMAKETA